MLNQKTLAEVVAKKPRRSFVRSYGRRSAAGIGALTVAMGALNFAAIPASATIEEGGESSGNLCWTDHKLEQGHVDAFYFNHNDGAPYMALKDDTASPYEVRDPSTVELHANEASLRDFSDVSSDQVPEGIAGQDAVYHLPLVQEAGMLWPGWESQPLAATPYDTVDINIETVEGPGDIYLWSEGSLGSGPEPILNDGMQLPGTIHQPYLAHTHAHWAFSEPGAYYLTVSADLHSSETGETLTLDPETYLFTAGNDLPADYQECRGAAGGNGGDYGNGDEDADGTENGTDVENGNGDDAASGGTGGGASGGDSLADTGTSSELMTGLGIGLLVVGSGTAALLLNRRQQEKSDGPQTHGSI